MNVDQAAFHLLAPFTDMPMRCLPEFSFKQFSSAIIFQHTHLLDGYPIQSHEPFALRYALVYEYGVQVFHIGEADQFIDGGIVTDIALQTGILLTPHPGGHPEHGHVEHVRLFRIDDAGLCGGDFHRYQVLPDGIGMYAVLIFDSSRFALQPSWACSSSFNRWNSFSRYSLN